MSNWTHVAGVVRIDHVLALQGRLDIDKIFGKECVLSDVSDDKAWDEWSDIMDDARENPNEYLPRGSEGSLRKVVWENPDKECAVGYTVTIFGDLRDHDNPQEIVDWFKNKIKNPSIIIRQATITVYNENNGTINWTYER